MQTSVQEDSLDEPSATLLFNKPSQQAIELLVAFKMLSRMSVEDMARLDLGPNTLAATQAEYKNRLEEAKWRAGEGSKQKRVKVSRTRGRG
jgi:hypothetical protein